MQEDTSLCSVELAGSKEFARRDERIVRLVHDRGLADMIMADIGPARLWPAPRAAVDPLQGIGDIVSILPLGVTWPALDLSFHCRLSLDAVRNVPRSGKTDP